MLSLHHFVIEKMPYPRFNKLPVEKRTKLLDIAVQEFAKYGFDDASVNCILEEARMSKGAAYYYFEDKVDLFCTVIQYAMEWLKPIDTQLDCEALAKVSDQTVDAMRRVLAPVG